MIRPDTEENRETAGVEAGPVYHGEGGAYIAVEVADHNGIRVYASRELLPCEKRAVA